MITAAELIERLAALPGETPVLVDGYEGYQQPLRRVYTAQMQQVDWRNDHVDYIGTWLTPAAAADELAGRGLSCWRMMKDQVAPVPVGGPVQAVVLAR